MPRPLISFVWAATLWNMISVFWGVEVAFRASSLAGDLMAGMITLAIVLFGVATAEIRETNNFPRFRVLWYLIICCGFGFAVVGNFSILQRFFHSPETPPTPGAIFWDEIVNMRGVGVLFFTFVFTMFATLHGRLPRGGSGGSFRFFRKEPPLA